MELRLPYHQFHKEEHVPLNTSLCHLTNHCTQVPTVVRLVYNKSKITFLHSRNQINHKRKLWLNRNHKTQQHFGSLYCYLRHIGSRSQTTNRPTPLCASIAKVNSVLVKQTLHVKLSICSIFMVTPHPTQLGCTAKPLACSRPSWCQPVFRHLLRQPICLSSTLVVCYEQQQD